MAASYNSIDVAKLLLFTKATVDAKDHVRVANGAALLSGWWLWVGQYGKTALHWAARHNSLEVAKLLLGAGAAADVKDKVSTLHWTTQLNFGCDRTLM